MFERQQNRKKNHLNVHDLLAEHQGLIRSYILSLTADIHITNDVLQETNLVICRKEADFSPGSNFSAWACRIAHFEVLRFRKSSAREKLVFDDGLVEILAEEERNESELFAARKSALKICIRKLSPENRKLVLSRYFEGSAVDQMAGALGIKPNAVSQKLFRIRKSLLRCIHQSMVDNRKA